MQCGTVDRDNRRAGPADGVIPKANVKCLWQTQCDHPASVPFVADEAGRVVTVKANKVNFPLCPGPREDFEVTHANANGACFLARYKAGR